MIKIDSKKVVPGDTFYALKGNKLDGHDYVEDAIKNGATTIYVEYGKYSKDVIKVDNTLDALANDLYDKYSYIFDKVKLIGITGTNGKTTTAYLTYGALNKLGYKSCYIGTLGAYIDDNVTNLNNTTPDIVTLYELFKEAYNSDCTYIVMEVSSHALKLGRVKNIMFDYAIYSNITSDHLDFHHTMEDYIESKQLLFKQVKKDGICIINNDDLYKDYMIMSNNNTVTYGEDVKSDYVISDYIIINKTNNFKLNSDIYKAKILGKYNVYNLTCLIIILELLNIDKDKIRKIVDNLNTPKGRMDSVDYGSNLIIVDYAHTYDAVKKY